MMPSTSVLIIDGDAAYSEHFVRRLRSSSSNYRVFQAIDGQSGLDLYKSRKIDCVVVELDLPDMSGFQILMNLVPTASSPEVGVIILTRLTNPMLAALALEQGAYACLKKPWVSGDQLEEAIRRAVADVRPARTTQTVNKWAAETVFQMF